MLFESPCYKPEHITLVLTRSLGVICPVIITCYNYHLYNDMIFEGVMFVIGPTPMISRSVATYPSSPHKFP